MDLLSTVATNLERAPTQVGVAVAISGGLDSTVLFDLVCRYAARSGIEVTAVHVDHGLREASTHDAVFCRRLAARRGVAAIVQRVDVVDDGSLQERARVQRYAALARAALDCGAGVLLTAHHADDALETALLNLRRGSSAGGLASLIRGADGRAPLASNHSLELMRPLIETSRAEIRTYAAERGLEWREDPTNETLDYQRNLLRQRVTPTLTDGGRLLGPALETLENLADEHRALEEIATEISRRAQLAPPDRETRILRAAPLAGAPRAVTAHVLRAELSRLPTVASASRSQIQRCLRAIERGDSLRLSIRGARLTVERGFVIIEVARGRGGKHLGERRAAPVDLVVDGDQRAIEWFGTTVTWRRLEPGEPHDTASKLAARVAGPAPGSSGPTWSVRGPRDGDRLDAAGMSGHKAVGQLLAESGVPRPLRWRWPCLVTADRPEEPVWVLGVRHAPAAACTTPDIEIRWDPAEHTTFGVLVCGEELLVGATDRF